jgi:hypothetical protein
MCAGGTISSSPHAVMSYAQAFLEKLLLWAKLTRFFGQTRKKEREKEREMVMRRTYCELHPNCDARGRQTFRRPDRLGGC